MKNAFLLCLLTFCVSFASFSQSGSFNATAASAALKDQANKAGTSFLNKDYKTFCKYTYPKLITMSGGEDKMIAALKQTMDQIKAQGVEVEKITYSDPGKAYKVGNVWQSTIAQHSKMKIPSGHITATSTLIAFSSDNGKTWTFLDTSNKDMATIRKMLPDLSPSIVIPPPAAPVQSAN